MQQNHRLLKRNQQSVKGLTSNVQQIEFRDPGDDGTVKLLDRMRQMQEEENYWVEWWSGIRERLQGYQLTYIRGTNKNRREMSPPGSTTNFGSEVQIVNQQNLVDEVQAPTISARSWVVLDGQSGRLIWGKNEHNRKEIASLTKIMTCLVTIQLLERLRIDPNQTYVTVSAYAASIGGTSANLRENDNLTVNDLLYGLMLPSGNDAASVLAENFGVYLYFQSKEFMLKYGNQDVIQNLKIISPAKYFVQEMNDMAVKLGLQETYYGNAHGLANKLGRSSAFDVAKLCASAMKIPYFQQIVGSRTYTCQILNGGVWRECYWENTNKLLEHGFMGIKTGITNEAGPCLASYFRSKVAHYIIVILNSQTKEERWVDTCKLIEWISLLYEH